MIYNSCAPLKDGNPIAALQQRNLRGGYAMPIKCKPAPCSWEELRATFDYCSETGHLIRRVTRSHNAKAGDTAGSIDAGGYRTINFSKSAYKAHRIVWYWVHGVWPTDEIDHINGVKDDNRIENLRLATRLENNQNSRNRKNNSGYRGVTYLARSDHVNRFAAHIGVNGKPKHLGVFATAEEAHEAYLRAKTELHTFQPAPRAA